MPWSSKQELEPRLEAPQLLPRARPKRKERYRLLKLIGQGGSGAVYKAEDLELDRTIAVKLLHPMLAKDERYINLLKREVVIASQITHPNIVRVFDVSSLRDSPMITMAYIQGENLASILHRDGPLSIPRIMHFGQQICSALEQAHRCGVVHRDLKPQNLLVDHQGDIYVSDFGLAHVSNAAGHEAIESSSRPGTLQYMSPEQYHALPCDPRCDVYCFGLILYEMLTGLALDVNHDVMGLTAIDRKTGRDAVLPENVSAPLAAIALRCLAQNPADRFQSASEILKSFSRAALQESAVAVPAGEAQSRWKRIRSDRGTRMAGATLLLLLGATGTWGPWHYHKVFASASFAQLYREGSSELQKDDDVPALKRAAVLFASAAALRPTEAVFEGLARAEFRLYQLGTDQARLTAAKDAVEHLDKLNQASRGAALLHAEIDMVEGAPASAVVRLNRMLASQRPSDDILRLLAKAQLLAGRPSESIATWKRAVDLNPNYWSNHHGFGVALMKLGRPDEAQVEFHRVIELRPDSYVGYANLGAAYLGSGEFRKAIEVTDKSLTIRATAHQYNNLATALYYTGSYHAAIQLFLKAAELNPSSELYRGNLGATYRCVGETRNAGAAYESAAELAQKSLLENPGNAKLMARLGLFLAKTGRMEEAKANLSSALNASPGNPDILYAKAQFAVVQNQYLEGAAALTEALDRGYSVKLAAHDPELKPLWADAHLKRKFEVELKNSQESDQGRAW